MTIKKLLFLSLFAIGAAFAQQEPEYTYIHKKWSPLTEQFVAHKDGIEIGYISYIKKLSNNSMQICMISIDKDHRSKGLGKRLMELGMEQIEKSGCEKVSLYATPNDDATDFNRLVNFYKNFGFTVKEDFGCGSAEMEKKL